MRAHDGRTTWYGDLASRAGSLPAHTRTALLLLPVILVAALLRLTGRAGEPPGFRHEEAGVALAAQQIERGVFPIYFRQGDESIEPAFVYAVNLTGQLAGWGVDGPRLAAALLGIAAAAGCSLWYRQVFGSGWGLVGGLLVATSFWQIAFSRQAVPSIAMAAVGAFGLWALYRAASARSSRSRQSLPSGWYGLAGLLLGIGVYTDVAMRAVLPVALLIGAVLAFRKGYLVPAADRRGLLFGGGLMLLIAAPLASYFWENPESFRLGIDNLRGGGTALENVRATLEAFVWSGESNPAHTYAGRPLLDPLLLTWGLAGLAFALRRPLVPAHAGALIWLGGFLIAIVVIAPGNHAQMLAITPALFFFPVRGMQGVLVFARSRGVKARNVALAVIALSVAGSAAWSMVTYVQWTSSADTYRAFNGDVRDAVSALEDLPNDNLMAYFGTGENGRIVRYLAPDRTRRDFDNHDSLPLPASGPVYLVVPDSAGPPEPLLYYLGEETLVTTGSGPERGPAYRIWLVDNRIRDRLPYAVPGIFFEGGPTLIGFEVAPLAGSLDGPAIDVVLVHRVAPGGDTVSALLRLVELHGETDGPAGTIIQPAPDFVTTDEIILSRISLPFPDTPGMVADLQTAVQTLDGEYLTPYGPNVLVIDDIWALLNAIGFVGPSP